MVQTHCLAYLLQQSFALPAQPQTADRQSKQLAGELLAAEEPVKNEACGVYYLDIYCAKVLDPLFSSFLLIWLLGVERSTV